MNDQHFQTNREENGLVWFSAPRLNANGGAVHGFSSRLGGVSRGYLTSLNLGTSRGDQIEHVRENFRRYGEAVGFDSADGLVTNCPGVPLAIFSADCIPILLHDSVQRVVAACHAGWRGTAAGIVGKTVQVMTQTFGCQPKDIRMAIGPGISRCCFETHEDVPHAMWAVLGKQADPFIDRLSREKFLVDLKGINGLWGQLAGVPANQIEISDLCTACRQDLFWSHRHVGEARGVMSAVIQLTE